MARSLALALLIALCLAAHLLTVACARHPPPGFDVVDTSPTNNGPSPAGGHGNQPSVDGASGVSTESRARGEFGPNNLSPCRCRGGEAAADTVQQHGAGDGEGPGDRP